MAPRPLLDERLPLFIERTEAVVLLRAGGRGLPAARSAGRALGAGRRTAGSASGNICYGARAELAVDGALAWCVQSPGDCVLIPPGLWHCTLKLEESVAFTRNIVNGRDAKAVRASGLEITRDDPALGEGARGSCGRGGPTTTPGNGHEPVPMEEVARWGRREIPSLSCGYS